LISNPLAPLIVYTVTKRAVNRVYCQCGRWISMQLLV